MTMSHDGLTKLIEECGELVQVAAKRIAFPNDIFHPDGSNQDERLQEEIGDVLGAIQFVIEQFALDDLVIDQRVALKLERFKEWHKDKLC